MKLTNKQKQKAIAAHHMLTIATSIIDWVIDEIKGLPLFQMALKKTCNTLQSKTKKIIEHLHAFDSECFNEADEMAQWLLEVAQNSLFLNKVQREEILELIKTLQNDNN